MTTNVPAEVVTTPGGDAAERPSYLNVTKGLWSWLGTLDHKRIGLMYLAGVSMAFLIGGIFALLIRFHLWNPNTNPADGLFQPDVYNRIFTMHGMVMVFIFIIPAIPAALGNFVLPLMLGTVDVALPRLNLASFYLWLTGTIMAFAAMIFGGIDTGWTFYTPYSIYTDTAVVLTGTAVFILGFSSIFTGLNFIVTTHKLRAPGMSWFRLPLFVWAIYATSILQVLATPVLGITILLLALEHAYGVGIFDPKLGGDPVLFEHMFWFYSHPAVYIMILPALGIISDVISTHARKPVFGYKMIAFSSIAIAVISFLVWGHHMFTSGQSEFAMFAFSFLTFFVGIPTAIKVFSWVATIWGGSIALTNPMLYALAFLVIFTIGGLTGIFLGILNLDIHLHDTYFVVAHFHYVMMGSTALAFFAGLHHWWPKMFGRHVLAHLVAGSVRADLRRVQPDLLPAVHHGFSGYAAPLRALPARVAALPPGVDHRRRGARRRHPDHGDLLRAVVDLRSQGEGQSVGWRDARVEDVLAAAAGELRPSAGRDPRGLRLLGALRG